MDAPSDSDSAATQPTPTQRVEELWFSDGNLIIQAGSSQFRVYRGILASRSPVFQDMLSFPQPPDSELVDGCPFVSLPDSEMEVRVFLKAIFDPEFFPPFPSPTEFAIAAGCLRLSHKYGVEYLHRRALVHLTSGCDTKLQRWDTASSIWDRSNGDVDVDRIALSDIVSWDWSTDSAALEIYAIQLFQEVDASWLLPNVFYNLSSSFEQGYDIFSGATYNGVFSTLSARDLKSFTKGHALRLYHPLCMFCGTVHGNGRYTKDASGSTLTFRSPMSVWENDGSWEMLEGLCAVCLPALRANYRSTRQAFWDQLPQMYDLPPWEELEQVKTAAIGSSFMPRPTKVS
ncbi:hypothetical protein FB45DRAFT_1065544 [Roridomyces roridus]|uniref:BTB domain-containing protein n=1 Tax=Roridomyces roridus TaxID=1738132 RepID=A0AAD7B750_9AGAR|nr:hypothetical protein FB45DRAFT_1065544 [Roridomyces roridus]